MSSWEKHTYVDHLPLDSYMRGEEGGKVTACLTYCIFLFLHYSNLVHLLKHSEATIKNVLKMVQSLWVMLVS